VHVLAALTKAAEEVLREVDQLAPRIRVAAALFRGCQTDVDYESGGYWSGFGFCFCSCSCFLSACCVLIDGNGNVDCEIVNGFSSAVWNGSWNGLAIATLHVFSSGCGIFALCLGHLVRHADSETDFQTWLSHAATAPVLSATSAPLKDSWCRALDPRR
jgi:hypothetical protein